MAFFSFYPPSGGGSASVGTNGATAPTQSTEVAGVNPSGNLQPLQTDANGSLITTPATGSVQHVIVDSSALPTGAATSANQTTGNASLASIDSKLTSPLAVSVNNFPATQPVSGTVTVTQATGTNLHAVIDNFPATQAVSGSVSVSNFPATQAVSGTVAVSNQPTTITVTQATGTNLHAVIDSGSVSVSNFPATQAVSGTVAVSSLPSIPAGSNAIGSVSVSNFPATQAISAASLPLPSGAATSANQTTEITALQAIQSNTNGVATAANQVTMQTSLTTIATNSSATQGSVTGGTAASKADLIAGVYNTTLPTLTTGQQSAIQLDSNGRLILSPTAATSTVKTGGKTVANAPTRNDYTVSAVTTGSYTTLVASMANAATEIYIFDSSGQTLALAVGAAGSEVIQLYITPGGQGTVPLAISAGVRVSVKAISAQATVGELDINYLS